MGAIKSSADVHAIWRTAPAGTWPAWDTFGERIRGLLILLRKFWMFKMHCKHQRHKRKHAGRVQCRPDGRLSLLLCNNHARNWYSVCKGCRLAAGVISSGHQLTRGKKNRILHFQSWEIWDTIMKLNYWPSGLWCQDKPDMPRQKRQNADKLLATDIVARNFLG